ncbi:MAG: hypothetical protein ACLRXC_06660 [[Clostridium] leptum]
MPGRRRWALLPGAGRRFRRAGRIAYTAAELFQIGLRELAADVSPSLTIICPDSDGILLSASYQRQWQDTLGVFINIEPLEPSELDSHCRRDYDLALCPVKASYDSPEAVLSPLYGGVPHRVANDQMAGCMNGANASTASGVLSSTLRRTAADAKRRRPAAFTASHITAPSVTGLRFPPLAAMSLCRGTQERLIAAKKAAKAKNASFGTLF